MLPHTGKSFIGECLNFLSEKSLLDKQTLFMTILTTEDGKKDYNKEEEQTKKYSGLNLILILKSSKNCSNFNRRNWHIHKSNFFEYHQLIGFLASSRKYTKHHRFDEGRVVEKVSPFTIFLHLFSHLLFQLRALGNDFSKKTEAE